MANSYPTRYLIKVTESFVVDGTSVAKGSYRLLDGVYGLQVQLPERPIPYTDFVEEAWVNARVKTEMVFDVGSVLGGAS